MPIRLDKGQVLTMMILFFLAIQWANYVGYIHFLIKILTRHACFPFQGRQSCKLDKSTKATVGTVWVTILFNRDNLVQPK